jgi:hypothetical protein
MYPLADSIKEVKMTTKEAEQYLEDFKKNMKERFQEMKIRKNSLNKIDERNGHGVGKEYDDNVKRESFAFADAEGENSNTLSLSTQNVAAAAGQAEGETTFAISLSILISKDDKRRCFIVKPVPCCHKKL